jgi:hypothetical protein
MSDKPVLSPDQPWQNAQVMCLSMLWDDGARMFKMCYSGEDYCEPHAIGYATSPDGLT